jgi:two-component system, OmpR family, response regulator
MLEILIVDDDLDTCHYLQDLLGTEGHNAQIVNDSLLTIETIRKGSFHLVLLDIMMPRLSGIQVLEQIRNLNKDLPVAILTGYPEIDTAIASIQHNVLGYIKKPFTINEIKEIVDKVAKKQGTLPDKEQALRSKVGRVVREARKAQEFTLQDLSQKTKLSISLLSQIERGEGNPTLQNIFRIAQSLNLLLSEIFKEY